ncbi:MAG: hypothetical protein JZU47_19430 [Prolixibacteraceae bacterium]|nr:hypothetical protein [Prolixibacteraceae bacterium]
MGSGILVKRYFFLLIFTALATIVSAQIKVLEVTHYLFPEFTKGVVLMKTGIKNGAMLNYNSLTEEMIFDNKGTKLAVSQLEQVDTVYISGRKFFILNNKFVELIYKAKYALYIEHKCSIKDPGKPAAYGGTSQTSATTSYSSYLSGGQVYELKLPEGYETKPFIDYWLKKDGKTEKFLSIRQLSKLFDEKESLFKEFVKKHDVKYDNQISIIELLKYMEAN